MSAAYVLVHSRSGLNVIKPSSRRPNRRGLPRALSASSESGCDRFLQIRCIIIQYRNPGTDLLYCGRYKRLTLALRILVDN
jgi:hypothetical protein